VPGFGCVTSAGGRSGLATRPGCRQLPLPADLKADLGPTSLNAVVTAEFTADEGNARRVLAAIRDTGGSHAERKRLTAIILKRATDAAREILEALMETDSMLLS
jgi:hypothetical protein